MNVLIVGRGRVGTALGAALGDAASIRARSRGRRIAASDVLWADAVILAVPDSSIEDAAESIARHLDEKLAVVHCAGARSTAPLRACKRAGASVGVMHPLVSFASTRKRPALGGTTFTVYGDPAAVRAARAIAVACGARAVHAKVQVDAYHAAAALVANGAAALAFFGVEALVLLGFSSRNARRAVSGLLHSVAANVDAVGVPKALTGPIARGDVDTVKRHRRALRRLSARIANAYDAVGPAITDTAIAAGLSPAKAKRVREAFRRR